MSETHGGFLECLIHAGWSLRHRGLTSGGQTSSPWLSADLPASPIQLLTPTPALLTLETFCWRPGSLPSWDVYEDVSGASSARLGEAHACFITCSRLQLHLHVLIAAHAGNFLNDHRAPG